MNIMRQKNQSTKKKLKNLIEKFKELKSLVYNYKDLKENEILKLSKNQDNLKNEIEANQNNYEALVDKTTTEIEDFIKKNNPDTKIQ